MVRLATLLGLVCEKMAKRVVKVREEQQERKAAQSLARIQVNAVSEVQSDVGTHQGAEDEIWETTDIVEEEYAAGEGETEDEVDVVASLLELAQWVEVEAE